MTNCTLSYYQRFMDWENEMVRDQWPWDSFPEGFSDWERCVLEVRKLKEILQKDEKLWFEYLKWYHDSTKPVRG